MKGLSRRWLALPIGALLAHTGCNYRLIMGGASSSEERTEQANGGGSE